MRIKGLTVEMVKAMGGVVGPAVKIPDEPQQASEETDTPTSGQEISRHTLRVDYWHPTPLNKLMKHWAERSRHKDADYNVLFAALMMAKIPPAVRKRAVRLHLVLPKGQRACDPDAYWKSLLDALVRCKALVNDSDKWCQLTPVTFSRGSNKIAFITLEDL